MLRSCVIDFNEYWEDHLALIKFAYNNSYHSSIKMAPYESLCWRRRKSPISRFEVGEVGLIGQNFVHHAMDKVKIIN